MRTFFTSLFYLLVYETNAPADLVFPQAAISGKALIIVPIIPPPIMLPCMNAIPMNAITASTPITAKMIINTFSAEEPVVMISPLS